MVFRKAWPKANPKVPFHFPMTLRQWSTDHPEFAFLPRKFKVAVIGSRKDHAVIKFHDIGLRLVRSETGEPGYEVFTATVPAPRHPPRMTQLRGSGLPGCG